MDRNLLCKAMMLLIDLSRFHEKFKSVRAPTVNCHSICRALARHIPELKLVDGHYIGMRVIRKGGKRNIRLAYCPHSWLKTPDGNIIDPYPVGFMSANPILVIANGPYKPFGGGPYVENADVTKTILTRIVKTRTTQLANLLKRAEGWKKRKERKK
jgi:hypothetical protein